MTWRTEIDPYLVQFIAEQDHFYLGTASADGEPYIQHRGGPKGFLKLLGPTTLGFADYSGNRQYLTLGNLAENPHAFLFLIDYPNRRRIKVRGTARAEEDDADLIRSLGPETIAPDYRARVERAILFEVDEWDINCPQHIQPRYDTATLLPAFDRLEARIRELEAKVREMGGDPGPFEHAG